MNWEAIAAVGQLVGALAVLVTLIYLGVQITQTPAAVATPTYKSSMTGFNDINVVVASHPALASLLDRGCQTPESLSAEEVVQFNFLLRCYANQWWKLFKLYERGGTVHGSARLQALPGPERAIRGSLYGPGQAQERRDL